MTFEHEHAMSPALIRREAYHSVRVPKWENLPGNVDP
jgi:hypothetical protein